jgi:hypothetical protein
MRSFSSCTIVFGAWILMPSLDTPEEPSISTPSMCTIRPLWVPESAEMLMFGPSLVVDM